MSDEILRTLKDQGETLKNQSEVLLNQSKTLKGYDEHIRWIKENMATKADIAMFAAKIDELLGLERKEDQELTFLSERVRRVEQKLELEPSI